MFDFETPFPQLQKAFANNPRSLLDRLPGILCVNKPERPSSAAVLRHLKWLIGKTNAKIIHKLGHGGTLDPMASGLLIVLAGRATRLFDSLAGFDKDYSLTVLLGRETETFDIEGRITGVYEGALPGQERILSVLDSFRGEIRQIAPSHSALKVNGTPLYKLARKGAEVPRKERMVTVSKLELLSLDDNRARFAITCSKGFYVRSFAYDLGRALGCGGMLENLKRTRIGAFSLDDARNVEETAEYIKNYLNGGG